MLKKIAAAIVGLLAAIYLLNPGAGVFEFIPDNIPLVGNLDEAGAIALLLSSLRYFGLDLSNLFGKDEAVKGAQEGTIKIIK